MIQKPEVKIKVSPGAIPAELKALDRWVLWKHVFDARQKRWLKTPFQVKGTTAKSNDPATWGSFESVFAKYESGSFDGVGFVFNGDGITGIDLDDVVDLCGELSPKAQQVLAEVPGYAERSPSGDGLHIITLSDPVATGKNKNGVEVYSSGRYFTFTGEQINGHTALPAERQDISPFLAKHFGEQAKTVKETSDLDDALSEKSAVGRSIAHMREVLKHIAPPEYEPECTPYIWALHHESGGSEEARELAHEWLRGDLHGDSQAKYDDAYVDERWGRSQDGKANAKTWRSVEFEAKKNGWTEKPVQQPLGEEFVPAARFASEQKVEWHIKHVLPKRGLIVVYGAPGSSKSFFALDMVAHVARGLPWRGHRVKQSKIAYVAAEGVAGFGSRLAAYSKGHGVSLDDVPVFVRGGSLVLKTQVLALCESIQKIGGVGIVVIDTLSAVTPGENENVSEGMGLAVNAANLIIESTGASVILIHHTNKTGEMRGWSGLLGAADNSIRIERKDDVRTAHIEKQKEGKDSAEYGYKLRVVDLYEDEDGDMVTSCVVEESEEIAKKPDGRKERKPRSGEFETSDNYAQARHFLQVIEELVGLSEANIDEADIISAIQSDEKANPTGQEDTPAIRSIKRTLHTLGLKGKIKKDGRWIRLCAD
jgi:hypothetical protein